MVASIPLEIFVVFMPISQEFPHETNPASYQRTAGVNPFRQDHPGPIIEDIPNNRRSAQPIHLLELLPRSPFRLAPQRKAPKLSDGRAGKGPRQA